METIEPLSPAEREELTAFFNRPDRPEYALDMGELQGFLFAVCCAPVLVFPSEWIPVVFGDEEPGFQDAEEAERILNGLMKLYNHINYGILEGRPELPPDCALREDPMANLEPDAPIAAWCEGFGLGHTWLHEAWEIVPEGEIGDGLGSCLTVLTFFRSRDMAEGYMEVFLTEEQELEEVAGSLCRLFPDAMVSYAAIGRALYEASYDPSMEDGAPARSDEGLPPIEPDEPCPCGSGRRFGACCGQHLH